MINECCKKEENLKEYKGENPFTEYMEFCKECGQAWLAITPFEKIKATLRDW